MLQGGDFERRNGTGGYSIYGRNFNGGQENRISLERGDLTRACNSGQMRTLIRSIHGLVCSPWPVRLPHHQFHLGAILLIIALPQTDAGKNTNGSQFFVTTGEYWSDIHASRQRLIVGDLLQPSSKDRVA
jgi:cyclophilin family peptidyl-prolyl cis-trans isomerase